MANAQRPIGGITPRIRHLFYGFKPPTNSKIFDEL
jgi:hypothetical protein